MSLPERSSPNLGQGAPEIQPAADFDNIVHDFNNLLMVMHGHAELLTMRLGASHPLYALAEEVLTAAERATQLVQQMRSAQREASSQKEPQRSTPSDFAKEPTCGASEAQPPGPRILVLDDERPLREVTVRFLRAGGFNVAEASTGSEALEMLRHAAPPFRLLLTDVEMPGMNGREVAEQAVRVSPSTAVVFASGYAQGAPIADAPQNRPVLRKPYSRAQLLEFVRLNLDPESAANHPGTTPSRSSLPNHLTAQSEP